MKKILIIGSGGAGKSTFARRLTTVLDIPVIHLDAIYWQRGWVEPPKDEWRRKVVELTGRDAWIMDGNYSGTLDIRLAACDTVIFLDLPRLVCLWRMVKRRILYTKMGRPDMAAGCPERFDWKFIKWIWTYPRQRKPKVEEKLKALSPSQRVIILKSREEIERFLTEAHHGYQTSRAGIGRE